MTALQISPSFAAFEFSSMDLARKAWRKLDGDPNVRNISAWASCPPDRSAFFVVILGERERQPWVDSAARIVMDSPGCLGDAILDDETKRAFSLRRYGSLFEELQRAAAEGKTPSDIEAEGGLKQKATYGAGAKMQDGRIVSREDG